jgi:hypothetical protein
MNIIGISSSRNREQGYLKIDLSVTGLSDIPSTISIRVYNDASKEYINRLTTAFLKTILAAADFPVDPEREPDWSGVCKALKGVTFDFMVRSKEGGVPFLTSLKVFSDIRTGDPWGVGPEEAERLRAFFLNDDDYL